MTDGFVHGVVFGGKGRRKPVVNEVFSRPIRPLQLVFGNLSGPRPTASKGGTLYIVLVMYQVPLSAKVPAAAVAVYI